MDKILLEMLTAEKMSDIDMLTESQLERLDENNRREKDYEITDMVTLFRRQAEKTPDGIAAVCLDKTLTYKELDQITDNVAAFLKRQGNRQGKRGFGADPQVGVYSDRLARRSQIGSGLSASRSQLSG